MDEKLIKLTANDRSPSGASGGRLTKSINSIARNQFKRYKRVRRLKPPTVKTALTGGDGISFGADPQIGP